MPIHADTLKTCSWMLSNVPLTLFPTELTRHSRDAHSLVALVAGLHQIDLGSFIIMSWVGYE